MPNSYQHLTVTRDGHIATVTLQRPTVANALSTEHLTELEQATLDFRDDSTTRVVIFTGAGKHFCGGADLNERAPDGETALARRRRLRMGERMIQAVRDMDQISIVAWHGAAMGGGACLATAVDFRIGCESALMAYPEIDLGMNLMWQSLPLCVQLVGPARAKRLVIGGERIEATTLLEWGVLDELVTADALQDKTLEWARRYAAQAPMAAQMIKRSVNHLSSALDRAIMHMDFDQNMLTATGADRAAAAQAYAKGKVPVFTGD
ncbi:MAG: enoyl-CoA hydratase/isomerase family protein [Pseudomonadales bacterium]